MGERPRPELPYTVRLLKALIASGKGCSLNELRVLLSLLERAGEQGQAWPSSETIAAQWAADERGIRRAMADLQKPTAHRPALIETISAGGGRGRSAVRRLVLEKSRGDETRDKLPGLENPGLFGSETRVNSSRKPGANRPPEETNEETSDEKGAAQVVRAAIVATAPPPSIDDSGVKSPHAELTRHFATSYERLHGVKWLHGRAKDGAAVNAILAAVGLQEGKTLVDRYLASPDPFYAKKGYSLAFMASAEVLNALRLSPKGTTNGQKTNGNNLDAGLAASNIKSIIKTPRVA